MRSEYGEVPGERDQLLLLQEKEMGAGIGFVKVDDNAQRYYEIDRRLSAIERLLIALRADLVK